MLFLIIEINNFRGDLTDVSALTKSLIPVQAEVAEPDNSMTDLGNQGSVVDGVRSFPGLSTAGAEGKHARENVIPKTGGLKTVETADAVGSKYDQNEKDRLIRRVRELEYELHCTKSLLLMGSGWQVCFKNSIKYLWDTLIAWNQNKLYLGLPFQCFGLNKITAELAVRRKCLS